LVRIEGAIDELDLTVKHIRTAIFGLERTRPTTEGLRSRVLAVAREAAGTTGFEPRVLLEGPLDTAVEDRLAAELVATLREALSNVARHAQASRVDVEVVVGGDVVLRVIDNGIGPPGPAHHRGNGLKNMLARAEKLGGEFSVRAAEPSGTIVEWRAPKG
jgi:signal transduction histidine kinase